MNVAPSGLRYSAAHLWARLEADGTVTVGITEFAQHQLGELQYVGLPRAGSVVKRDASLGEVESTKTVSDLSAPCSGRVVAINEKIVNEPALVNADPYGAGWVARIEPVDRSELDGLLDEGAYADLAAQQSH